MRRNIVVIAILMSTFLIGCISNKSVILEETKTNESTALTTSDSVSLYSSDEIPLDMSFETGSIALNDYFIGEYDTSIGYTSFIVVEFEYPGWMQENERYWFFSEDFKAQLYIKNDDYGIDEFYLLNDSSLSEYFDVAMDTLGNSVYFTVIVQEDGRYSLEGSEIGLLLNYQSGDENIIYDFITIIDETHMLKIDINDNIKYLGDDAAEFAARRIKLEDDLN